MRYVMTFDFRPDTKSRDEGIARFRKNGGQPPKGAKLLARWTRADFAGGFTLLESDDPIALAEFALAWSDLMKLEITPVLDDENLTAALTRAGK